MNKFKLRQDLIHYDGLALQSFVDVSGNLLGGIKHLLTVEEEKLFPVGTDIPILTVNKWFDTDVATAIAEVRKAIRPKTFDLIDEVRQRVLVHTTFIFDNIEEHTDLLYYVRASNWNQASKELRHIDARRRLDLANAMRTGKMQYSK